VLGYVVLPTLGAIVDVYLITKLGAHALLLGGGWLVLGVVYLLVLTRGLRKAPPEFSVEDANDLRTDVRTS
jgi:hypothetical protein